jgi:dolichol kinase
VTAVGAHSPEFSRKVLHLTAAATPIVYMFVSRQTALCVLVPCFAIAVLIEIFRLVSPRFATLFRRTVGFMVRTTEWTRVTGATYVLLGALLSVWLFAKPIAVAVLFIQVISDTAASLLGLRYGRTRFLGKSVVGSGAFFLTALAILWLSWPAKREIDLIAAAVATLAEAVPALRFGRYELNDNLVVPLLTGLVLSLLLGADIPVR